MALTVEVKNAEGKKVGSVDLPSEIFDAQTNIPLIHQVVTAQLAAARQGTQKAKNRGETSGSCKKPFKQKGTGRARQGSVRAPLQRGGGAAHAVRPRSYLQRTPKKMIAQALRGVLSDRQRNERISRYRFCNSGTFNQGSPGSSSSVLNTQESLGCCIT